MSAIYPTSLDRLDIADGSCAVCDEPLPEEGYVYVCEEWSCWTHRECIHKFLETKKGKIFLSHRHAITIAEEVPWEG